MSEEAKDLIKKVYFINNVNNNWTYFIFKKKLLCRDPTKRMGA